MPKIDKQKTQRTLLISALFSIGCMGIAHALKEPLTTEQASKQSIVQRLTYYRTAFAEAIKELPDDYAGYQRIRPLLDGAMSQLVRGNDGNLSQNIHPLFDPIYGRWGRLLVDRLWQITENTLGKGFSKPAIYSALQRTQIVTTFSSYINLPTNSTADKTALFNGIKWRNWPTWKVRAQADTQGTGLFGKITFVEMLDLALKLHAIESPILVSNEHAMTLAQMPLLFEDDEETMVIPIQPTVGLMAQLNGQVNDMVLCGGGCASGSFWRLLYVMVGAFQEKLDTLEEEIQVARLIVASSELFPSIRSTIDNEGLQKQEIMTHQPSQKVGNHDEEEKGVRKEMNGDEALQKNQKNTLPPSLLASLPITQEENKNTTQKSDQDNKSPLSPPPYAPPPGPVPVWDNKNRALSLKRLSDWQKKQNAYDAYQKWLRQEK